MDLTKQLKAQRLTEEVPVPLTLELSPELSKRLDQQCHLLPREDGKPSDRAYIALQVLSLTLPPLPKRQRVTATIKNSGKAQAASAGKAN